MKKLGKKVRKGFNEEEDDGKHTHTHNIYMNRYLYPFFTISSILTLPTPYQSFPEHIMSSIVYLLQHLTKDRDESKIYNQHYSRLISKFKENGYEKVERLVELHLKYLIKARKYDQEINEEKERRKAAGEELSELDEEYYLTLRLDEGHLFTLQLVDRAIAYVATAGEKEVTHTQSLIIYLISLLLIIRI